MAECHARTGLRLKNGFVTIRPADRQLTRTFLPCRCVRCQNGGKMAFSRIGIIAGQAAIIASLSFAFPASAQDRVGDGSRQTRITSGVQLGPSYPGSDEVSPGPLFSISRKSAGSFAFEAPDESFGVTLWGNDRLSFGPVLGYEGSRTSDDVGAPVPKVDSTIEAGAFVEYRLAPNLRLRAEGRRGIGGHDGWIGTVGADYIARSGDDWLVSVGPRLTVSDDTYQEAYFSVAPGTAGLSPYNADGGLQAVGAVASFLKELSPQWGIYGYTKYDRLVGDPGDSPIVERFGSRNQYSGGVGLSYTFD